MHKVYLQFPLWIMHILLHILHKHKYYCTNVWFFCFICICYHSFRGLTFKKGSRHFFSFSTWRIILWRHHACFSSRLFRSECVSFILLNPRGRTVLGCKKRNIICHRVFPFCSFILLLFCSPYRPLYSLFRYFSVYMYLLFQATRVCPCYTIVSKERGHFNCTRNPSSIVSGATQESNSRGQDTRKCVATADGNGGNGWGGIGKIK
jgi:hypothetical protein